jgi:hypothetical protein|tara:strand:- start:254 stop:379 length:126 start_codon:yes stop_codon:yes gene_type:complete
MIKKILLLVVLITLVSCAKPEQDGRLIVQVLKHAVTQGIDF